MFNETNITIDIAKVVIDSQKETQDFWTLFWTLVSQFIIPIISILTTGYIAHITIKNNARSLFIQANQTMIMDAITALSKKIQRGQKDEIMEFLNSSEGIYIPEPLKTEIRKCLTREIDSNQINKMLDKISEYLSP